MRYFFEDYSFDTDLRELRRGPEVIPTTPQVFDLLDYLIRNRDRVVSKDNLVERIWNGRIVSDAAVTTRLNAARKPRGPCHRCPRAHRRPDWSEALKCLPCSFLFDDLVGAITRG